MCSMARVACNTTLELDGLYTVFKKTFRSVPFSGYSACELLCRLNMFAAFKFLSLLKNM